MRTRAALVMVVAAIVALASPAHAKGPSGGVIEGEGLDAPIAITSGEGTPSGDHLIDDVGFFAAAFGQLPDPMLDDTPVDDLGPKLTIRWVVPGMDVPDTIVQDLYPYAVGGPLVFTPPDQPFFGTERTRGGWFRAPDRLVTTLTSLGLPSERDLASGDGSSPWAPIVAAIGAVVLLGTALAVLGRRREVTPAVA